MRSRLFIGLMATVGLGLYLCPAVQAAAAPDKNGITWDDPKAPAAPPAASAPAAPAPTQLTTPPPANNAPPASASASSGTLDNAGIIWNTPGKPGAAPPPAGISPAPRNTTTAAVNAAGTMPAVNAAGPCHEFQTTIVIDGRKQPAHGTVCQQPDGSWHVVDR